METLSEITRKVMENGSEHRQGLFEDGSNESRQNRADFFRKHCESPIEFAFAMAFTDHKRVHTFAPDDVPESFHDKSVLMVPQLKVMNYRLDFAVLFQVDGRLQKWAVECDGREWHSTEQQVSRDQSRDQALASNGWRVLRYPGYLIHYGAGGMADRVHLEIDAFRCGYDARSILDYFAPEQFEEIGDEESARWYRETKPLSYQQEET